MEIIRKIERKNWDKMRKVLLESGIKKDKVTYVLNEISTTFLGYEGQDPEVINGKLMLEGYDFTRETLTKEECQMLIKE